VHPFEKRLRLLEEAQEQMKQKMDETDGEGLEERVSDLESKQEESVESFRICSLMRVLMRGRWSSLP
jgi:hypothetical protein